MKNFIIPNAYLSSTVYDNLVPKDDFLRLLLELIDWREMVWDLCKLAKNDEGGRPRYNHVLLFKMLFLSFLFNTSDRDTEELCTNNIRCKFFLGLELQENAPDFTTLCRFRNDLLAQFGKEWLDDVFSQIIAECKKLGVKFGAVHALDATHSIARVD
ncbi:transposase, partial [Candidatus Uhrbacteria bacterium]|nr:transposase [Candidatus Uhrbacteria bacterium]